MTPPPAPVQAVSIQHVEYDRTVQRADPGHVLILSIDGLREADVADPALAADMKNLTGLQAQGVCYTRAFTTCPSDSFPGTAAFLTGAGPAANGIYYDVSYDRSLFAPGSDRDPHRQGTVVRFNDTADKNPALLSGGGDCDASSINPAALPIDVHGHAIYPHDYLKVNTIFNVVHDAGLGTAYTDKHPVYDLANGPEGDGVDDLYTPEIDAKTALLDRATHKTINADALFVSQPFADLSDYTLVDASTDPLGANDPNLQKTSTNILLAEKYDDLHVQAILNEIAGKNSRGNSLAPVPALIGGNFQAVSIAEKRIDGGIGLDDQGKEIISLPLQSAMLHTDTSIGRIETALKRHDLWPDTLLVVMAKHGQNPRIRAAQLLKGDTLKNVLSNAGIAISGAANDDGSIMWLTNQEQSSAAGAALEHFRQTGSIAVYTKGVKSTVPASSVIDRILWGKSEITAGFGDASANSRTPDLVVMLKPGFILYGNPTRYTYKNAEHGGFTDDDTHVGLIVAGGMLNPAITGSVDSHTVHTQQVAVTALLALGLNPKNLQGAVIDRTPPLPGLSAPPTQVSKR